MMALGIHTEESPYVGEDHRIYVSWSASSGRMAAMPVGVERRLVVDGRALHVGTLNFAAWPIVMWVLRTSTGGRG